MHQPIDSVERYVAVWNERGTPTPAARCGTRGPRMILDARGQIRLDYQFIER